MFFSALDCLRAIPGQQLAEAQKIFFDWHPWGPEREPMNVFSPRSDPESADPFLPEHPLVAMENGRINPVPYMTGYAKKEGIWRANYVLPDVEDAPIWKDFVASIPRVAPMALGIHNNESYRFD